MDVGSLREVVTIQQPTVVVDAIGGQTEGAPTTIVANLPAAVEPLSVGLERMQVNQLRTSVGKRVRIRWRDDITTEMQVLWRGKTLEIAAVDEPPRREELHLLCAEVQ
jgi:SPP1 family predicted phage head-tail adaptor